MSWELTSERFFRPRLGGGRIEITARDRAQNETSHTLQVDVDQILPRHVQLGENFPNPFNPETTIPFLVPPLALAPGGSTVRLVIYNTVGQQVRLLLDGNVQPGVHHVVWDGRNAKGLSVGSGTYFYRLTVTPSGDQQTRPMTLVK